MRTFYSFCSPLLVIALQFHESLTLDLGESIHNAVESVKTSDIGTKIKEWMANLEHWSSTEWECGADSIWPTKLISKAMAQKKCSTSLEQINSACRWHDICYSQGLEGQEACDEKFCDALNSIHYTSDTEKKQCDLPKAMCEAVKFGGALVYQDKTKH